MALAVTIVRGKTTEKAYILSSSVMLNSSNNSQASAADNLLASWQSSLGNQGGNQNENDNIDQNHNENDNVDHDRNSDQDHQSQGGERSQTSRGATNLLESQSNVIVENTTSVSQLESTLRATEAAFARSATISGATDFSLQLDKQIIQESVSSSSSLMGGLITNNVYSPTNSESRGESKPLTNLTVTSSQDLRRKFRLFLVPSDREERDSTCFTFIGEGSTIYVRQNCRQKHRGGQFAVLPGEAYVLKTKDKIFMEPHSNVNFLEPRVVTDWLSSQKTLLEWNDLFKATDDANNKDKIAQGVMLKRDDIKVRQNLKSALMKHKTPHKLQAKIEFEDKVETENLIKSSPTAKKLEAILEESINDPSATNRILRESFANVDLKINTLFDIAKFLEDQIETLSEREHINSMSLETKHEDLLALVGKKPIHISAEYDTPSLWSTLTEVIDQIKSQYLKRRCDDHELLIRTLHEHATTNEDKSQQGLLKLQSQLTSRIKSFEDSASTIFKYIQNDLISIKQRVGGNQTINVNNSDESDLHSLKNDMDKLISQVNSLTSRQDERAIKFNKLGFKTYEEAGAWYAVNVHHDSFGLVVDFHTVMENIYNKTSRLDVIKKLEHVYKIQLTDISQATSMASFESSIPKVLIKEASGEHTAIKNNESYFTKVKSFEAYDMPHDGLKARINDLLQIYLGSQMNKINNILNASDPFYSVAILSLNTSSTFITSLLNFMETTYRTYVRSQFSTAKSWHITTRLARSIIEKINKPRYGVLESFKAGDAKDIGKAVFYSTLRCLDIMTEMIRIKFDNDPIIANELVKFLSLNNDNESVKRIEKESNDLKIEVKGAQKDMKEGLKAMQSVGNRADELKKTIENLTKRVKSLEQHNKNNKRQRRADGNDSE